MYDIFTDLEEIDDVEAWLSFESVDPEPIQGDWVHVHQLGRSSISLSPEQWDRVESDISEENGRIGTDTLTLTQSFNIQPCLVPLDALEVVLNADPTTALDDIDFSPMEYGRRRPGMGEEMESYWEEDLSTTVDGVEVARFVTNFQYEAPLIDTGFIEYHDLIEHEKRRFETIDSDEVVATYDTNRWETTVGLSGDESGHTIRCLRVQAPFLKEYLEERQCALVLGYIQRRSVNPGGIGTLPDDEREFSVDRGTATLQLLPANMPMAGDSTRLYWTCPIRPDDIPESRTDRLASNRNLTFRTRDGVTVTKEGLDGGEAAAELGLDRPATGPDDYDYLHFEPSLLERYRTDSRGTVEEWSAQGLQVTWLDKWTVRLYRNGQEQLVLLVDDLQSVPDYELPHWNQHHVTPEGELPEELETNYIEADWVDTESPIGGVVAGMAEATDTFEAVYGCSLFSVDPPGIDLEPFITPTHARREELLRIMIDIDQILIETIEKDHVEAQLPDDIDDNAIDGEKDALYELVQFLTNSERAGEVLAPFNAIHWFRNDRGHEGVDRWDDALTELGLEQTADIQTIYRVALRSTARSFHELSEILQS